MPRTSGFRVLVHADAIPARPPRRSGRRHRLLIRIDPGTTGQLARRLPGLVAIGAADVAGTVADGNGGHLVGEEDPVRHVPAARGRSQRRRTLTTPPDPCSAVTGPPPFSGPRIMPAFRAHSDVV